MSPTLIARSLIVGTVLAAAAATGRGRRDCGWIVVTEDGTTVVGPEGISAGLRERLAAGDGEVFRMGETVPGHGGRRRLVYDTGRYLGPASRRCAPLIEHGYAWSGARWIEYAREGRWVAQAGLWRRPAWWRCRLRYRRYGLAQCRGAVRRALGRSRNPLLNAPR